MLFTDEKSFDVRRDGAVKVIAWRQEKRLAVAPKRAPSFQSGIMVWAAIGMCLPTCRTPLHFFTPEISERTGKLGINGTSYKTLLQVALVPLVQPSARSGPARSEHLWVLHDNCGRHAAEELDRWRATQPNLHWVPWWEAVCLVNKMFSGPQTREEWKEQRLGSVL